MPKSAKQHRITTQVAAGRVSRRKVIKGIGAATGAAAVGLKAPFVHAAEKEIRFLNGEPTVESVRAMKFAAAQY